MQQAVVSTSVFAPRATWPDPPGHAPAPLSLATRRISRGCDLVREGDAFHSMYAVRSGSFKSSLALEDGSEQVTRFSLPGDLLGFDGCASGRYATTASALEPSEVWVIPYVARGAGQGDVDNPLQGRIDQVIAAELVRAQRFGALLMKTHSHPRVAAFLLEIAAARAARRLPPTEIHLRMSRADIGSYLGLSLETVSRAMSAFAERGWLEVRKKRVRLIAPDELVALCERHAPGLAARLPAE